MDGPGSNYLVLTVFTFVGYTGPWRPPPTDAQSFPAGRAQALVADARVIRRGSSLCFCEVKVTGADDDALVAAGLVTYKLG